MMTFLPRNYTMRVLAFFVMILGLSMYGRAQLTVSVSTDKPVYNYGETITLMCTVTNQADTAVEVFQAYLGPVASLTFDNIQLGWIGLDMDVLYEYGPHTSQSWELIIDGYRLGLPNKEGSHTLTCSFAWQHFGSYIINYMRDSISISQPVFYGGELQVGYSIHTPRSEIQSLLDSMNATVVSSDTFTFSETVYDSWQTSGFILDSLLAKYASDSTLSWIAIIRSISEPTAVITGIASLPSKPVGYRLSQNYPNPFNPSTTIRFEVPKNVHITLSVYNVLGQEIDRIVEGVYKQGIYDVVWDASRFPSGVYFYRLQSGTFMQSRKLLLLK